MSKFNLDIKLGSPTLKDFSQNQIFVKREDRSVGEIAVTGVKEVVHKIKLEDVKPHERKQLTPMVIEPQNAVRQLRMKRSLDEVPQKEVAASFTHSSRQILIKKIKKDPTPATEGTLFCKSFYIKAEPIIPQSAGRVQLPKKEPLGIQDHNYISHFQENRRVQVKFESKPLPLKIETPDQETIRAHEGVQWMPGAEAMIQTVEETVKTCEQDATDPAQEEVIVISSQDGMMPKPEKEEVIVISDDCYVVQPIKNENETDQEVIEISSESHTESFYDDSWEQDYSSDTTSSSSEHTDDSYCDNDDDDDEEQSEASDTSEEDEPPLTVKKGNGFFT